jgi:outer membrane protein insertion porin family
LFLAVVLLCACGRPSAVAPRPTAVNEVSVARAVLYDGARYKTLRLRFIGNEHAESTALARELTITHGLVDRELLDHDKLLIASFYYDRAYLDVSITESVTTSADAVTVTFTIREGSPYHVRSIAAWEDISGKRTDPIAWSNKLRPGDLFRRAELLHSLDVMRTAYQDLGYASVEANPDFDYDQQSHELTIRVPVTRGPVTYFEQIDIVGEGKLAQDVIRKELLVKVGDRFSMSALIASKKKLIDSAWFTQVDFATFPGTTKDRIRLSVEVAERPASSPGEVALSAMSEQ